MVNGCVHSAGVCSDSFASPQTMGLFSGSPLKHKLIYFNKYNRKKTKNQFFLWNFPILWEPIIPELSSIGRRGSQFPSSGKVYKTDNFQEMALRDWGNFTVFFVDKPNEMC
jgi:hypothetical protein